MTYGEWELSSTLHNLLLALAESGIESASRDEVEERKLCEVITIARRIAERYRFPCPGNTCYLRNNT
jgi:hypothetical protein